MAYDIFISFKNTNEDGTFTRDSEIAKMIYEHLSELGLKVFFSNVTLEIMGASKYRDAINDALDESQALIVIGTSRKNMMSKQVKKEWESFDEDITTEIKPSGQLFSYIENIGIKDLPRTLRGYQAFIHEPGSIEKLSTFIINALKKRDNKPTIGINPQDLNSETKTGNFNINSSALNEKKTGWISKSSIINKSSTSSFSNKDRENDLFNSYKKSILNKDKNKPEVKTQIHKMEWFQVLKLLLKYRGIDEIPEVNKNIQGVIVAWRKGEKEEISFSKVSKKILDENSFILIDYGKTVAFLDASKDKEWDDDPAYSMVSSGKIIDDCIVKLSYPFPNELFFNTLERFPFKVTFVISIEEIRKERVIISDGLSWEQTALDLIYELVRNKNLVKLLNCNHLIITIKSEGALYLKIENGNIKEPQLIFDNGYIEGEWSKHQDLNEVEDETYFHIAGLIQEMIFESNPSLVSALSKGISSCRIFQREVKRNDSFLTVQKVVHEIFHPQYLAFAYVPTPDLASTSTHFKTLNWTILKGNYDLTQRVQPMYDIAINTALYGESELLNTPFLRIGVHKTYDRKEIESFRRIFNQIDNYINNTDLQPLSILISGNPLSGQMFIIRQIHKKLEKPLQLFNLEEFSDVGDIVPVFYTIRESAMVNSIPVIVWEEYDTKDFYWCKFFKQAMRKGTFMDGSAEKFLGKCIFIFVSESNNESSGGANKGDNSIPCQTDFKSLISLSLCVKGINQRIKTDRTGEILIDEEDIYFPIYRALLIQAFCGKKVSRDSDIGLINAFVKTSIFKNNVRSFERLFRTITNKKGSSIRRENLPDQYEIQEHVDYHEFISLIEDEFTELSVKLRQAANLTHKCWLERSNNEGWRLKWHIPFNFLPRDIKKDNYAAVERIPLILKHAGYLITEDTVENGKGSFIAKINHNLNLLEELARIEHNEWMKYKTDKGWKYGVRNDYLKTHDWLVPYEVLPEDVKKALRNTIKNIPDVLERVGFYIDKS